ncbi:RNA 2'-phosphotransferase [Rothia nasisuis]|nr:RNA 2'-phosphotransferase [Rothia nasisuis]
MITNNLSKLVSYALRHRPEEFNLTPDSQGWLDLDDLVRGIKNYSADYSNVTIEDLHQMVETAHKKTAPDSRPENSGFLRALRRIDKDD